MDYKYAAIAVVLIGAFSGALLLSGQKADLERPGDRSGLKTFSSEAEFRSYIQSSSSSTGYTALSAQRDTAARSQIESSASGDIGSASNTKRYSNTNVQVENVDEPDILKTNGEEFYYSPERSYYPVMVERGVVRGSILPRRLHKPNISVFNALPAEDISETAEIPGNGKMLLKNDTLIVFSNQDIKGYDVSDPSSPGEKWDMELEASVVTSRMTSGKVYMVLKDYMRGSEPCPVKPLKAQEQVIVPCTTMLYDPGADADSTYTVVSFDPETGKIGSKTSFVGPSSNSEVYMSKESIYITYLKRKDRSEIMLDFFGKDRGLLDRSTRERIDEIINYDISDQSKIIEIRRAIENYKNSIEDREEFDKRLDNRFGNYTDSRKRELTRTGIIRIDADEELSADQKGEVPGRVLNQFSIDEYEGNVRVATTVDGGFGLNVKSENDIYILDKDSLNVEGSVKGLGLTERIYSARFIGDKAYLVTFRRIDPFHVLDLSDPEEPVLKGDLKLPGFSSYLHPLDEGRILGIGEENNSVKTVIFDVSRPESPEILDEEKIDEYSSEIGRNHHAFLLDEKHRIFFLPAADKGYVLSYEDGIEKLTEIKVENPKRARYINDNLYIFGDRELVVLDETSWEEVKRLKFQEDVEREPAPKEPELKQ